MNKISQLKIFFGGYVISTNCYLHKVYREKQVSLSVFLFDYCISQVICVSQLTMHNMQAKMKRAPLTQSFGN